MLYLASRFVWFLLAALVLGFVMGWVSQSGRARRLWSQGWSLVALLWIAGAALAWFQFVNGVPAMWLETALLFVAIYWLGCVAGALLHRVEAVVEAEVPAPAVAAAAAAVAANAPAAATAEPAVQAEPKAGEALPPVENEAAIPGQRPSGLIGARDGKADDLKLISGVGRQNEARLHALGIWHFAQIAGWTPENIEWVGSYLAFPGRIEREDWVGQAKHLAAGETTAFAKRVRAGLVETSLDEETAGQNGPAVPGGKNSRGKARR